MRKPSQRLRLPALLAGAFLNATAAADSYFEVTVTNITKGVVFTPVMCITP